MKVEIANFNLIEFMSSILKETSSPIYGEREREGNGGLIGKLVRRVDVCVGIVKMTVRQLNGCVNKVAHLNTAQTELVVLRPFGE